MKKSRTVASFGLILGAGLILAACSSDAAAEIGETQGDTSVKLAVVVANSNPWNTEYGESFQAAAEQLGATDVRVLNANGDAQKQSEQIDSLLNAGYKGIGLNLAAPNTAELSKKFAANDAYFANIFQNEDWKTVWDADEDRQVSYVSPNYYQSATDAVDYLAEALDGEQTEIIALAGNQSPYTISNQAYLGLVDGLEKYPNLELVGNVDTEWTAETGQQKVADLLAANPNAGAFFATDAADVEGAVAAIRAIGKEPGKDVLIVSAHAAGTVVPQYIQQGLVLAGAAMPGAWTGYHQAALLFDALNGEFPDDGLRQLELTLPLITADNVDDYLARYDRPISEQLSARLISQVYSGDDWDYQAIYSPITELPHLWPVSDEPEGYTENATFVELRDSGALDEAQQTLDAHNLIDPFDPDPDFSSAGTSEEE